MSNNCFRQLTPSFLSPSADGHFLVLLFYRFWEKLTSPKNWFLIFNQYIIWFSMKLLFLGTGSPEGNPSPFCNCINCQYVRRRKGKNIRLQASLLINDDLLIDFGPDVTRAFNKCALSMSKLKYALITHCHHDHFYPGNFFNRLIGPRTSAICELHIFMAQRESRLFLING